MHWYKSQTLPSLTPPKRELYHDTRMVKSLSKDMHSSTSLGKMHDIQSPLPSWDTQKRTIWESTSINWSETTIVNISFRPSTSRVQFFASIANPKPPGFKKPLRSCLMSLTMCNIDTSENTQNFFLFFFFQQANIQNFIISMVVKVSTYHTINYGTACMHMKYRNNSSYLGIWQVKMKKNLAIIKGFTPFWSKWSIWNWELIDVTVSCFG